MDWLARFHAGERAVTEEVYRGFLDTVDRGVAGVLQGADRETVVHEVFLRLMTDAALRQAFHGGDLGAWLLVIARNHAIDYARRRNRETPSGLEVSAPQSSPDALACRAEARLLLDRFWTELLPPKWRGVFEARFVRSLSQTEAAIELGVHRTTLMYQELRIRQLLREFLLEDAP
ncbi:MAG: sigma-70 family RNA polymerase sigma factor [Deltaproteobacteria bacterium]|nr:sigma-70 family RNA polymerase sigma factor [Deltaproteobacteria bacterium]